MPLSVKQILRRQHQVLRLGLKLLELHGVKLGIGSIHCKILNIAQITISPVKVKAIVLVSRPVLRTTKICSTLKARTSLDYYLRH